MTSPTSRRPERCRCWVRNVRRAWLDGRPRRPSRPGAFAKVLVFDPRARPGPGGRVGWRRVPRLDRGFLRPAPITWYRRRRAALLATRRRTGRGPVPPGPRSRGRGERSTTGRSAGLMASSASHRQIVVPEISATRPRVITSARISGTWRRESGNPSRAGSSQAIAFTSTTSSGGKSGCRPLRGRSSRPG